MPVISASQWGSPFASKRVLLIHGMTVSASSWQGLAEQLAAEGFFVVAPNLLLHGWRQGSHDSDYLASGLAEDLHPYLDTSYDVVIGHSLGGPVALLLLPFLRTTTKTTVILVDPPLEISDKDLDIDEDIFMKEITSAKTVDDYMKENPRWSLRDATLRVQGLTTCLSTDMQKMFQRSRPWSFSGLLKNIPSNVKMTILFAEPDPRLPIKQDPWRKSIPSYVHTKDIKDTGHWMQFERPDAIMDAVHGTPGVPQARAGA